VEKEDILWAHLLSFAADKFDLESIPGIENERGLFLIKDETAFHLLLQSCFAQGGVS